MKNLNPLITVVKDLETSFKVYQRALKHESPEDILEKQLNFLKIMKVVVNLFKKNSDEPSFKTLKKQAADIIQRYEKIKENFKEIGNTEILCSSFDEDQDVYQNPQQILDKVNEERRREVENIHREMIQLNQIFNDFNDLANGQGEMLDKVIYDVECAERTTDRVNAELQKAKFWQSQARRKCCWIAGIIIVIFLIIAGVVAGILLSKS
jgi:t-SNARE complex subunit (syntaxin)